MEKLLRASYDNIHWFDLPTPSPDNYKFESTHLENSTMSATGYLLRQIIRRSRRKVSCGWNALKPYDVSLLDSLYEREYFYLMCTDNQNRRVTMKVYAGPLTAQTKTMDKETAMIKLRTDIQMNFIEY